MSNNDDGCLKDDIRNALNRRCRENESNTPDFILADFMFSCLKAFEEATKARDQWYGISPRPGMSAAGKGEGVAHDRVTINVLPTPTVTAFEGRPMQSDPAPVPAFKVGDRVTNPKGRCGNVVALYPDQMFDLSVRWDGDPHSFYERSRELRPAPTDPAPTTRTPKTLEVGDRVRIVPCGTISRIDNDGQVYVDLDDKREHQSLIVVLRRHLELVRRAEGSGA